MRTIQIPAPGKRHPARTALLLLAFLPLALPFPVRAQAPNPAMLDEFVRDPMSFFFNLRASDAILCGQSILSGERATTPAEREKALTALAAIYVSSGKSPQARAAFVEYLKDDPTADVADAALLPPPVVSLFYTVRDSLLTASGTTIPPDVRTVAVGEIENNSIVPGSFNLDYFARGLTQILTTDLQDATPLRIVDRQRLGVLMKEIELNQHQASTDPAFRVRLGKLTGAQSFLFGSLMQVDKKKIRLDLRWVQTETGEVLLSEGVTQAVRSSDDLFKLERKVLLDMLVPRMQGMLAGSGNVEDLKKRIQPYLDSRRGQSASLQLLLKTGEAMLAEDRGDFQVAAAAWDEASRLAPSDALASGRSRALQAYLLLGKDRP